MWRQASTKCCRLTGARATDGHGAPANYGGAYPLHLLPRHADGTMRSLRSMCSTARTASPPTSRFPGRRRGRAAMPGHWRGGYVLYIKDGILKYAHNYVGRAIYQVVSAAPMPEGRHQLRFEFEVTGQPGHSTWQRHAGPRPALHRRQAGRGGRDSGHHANHLQPWRPNLWLQSWLASHTRVHIAVRVHWQNLQRDGGRQR